jgi:predicted DNA binding CopG/RHH family protein
MVNLDPEEQNLVNSFEKDEWHSVADSEEELKRYRQYARDALRKDTRVNIRISRQDLEALQKRAIGEGLPFQTLLASVLHKYINGHLVEKQG